MNGLMYRFRSLDKLLGRDDEPGELVKLEIYFSEPSQLNDPLEGYKDIYWSGDLIVWENLIRHYIRSMLRHAVIQLQHLGVDEPVPIEVLVRDYDCPIPLLVEESIMAVQDRVFSFSAVSSYLEALADFRQVRVQELEFHLKVLHRIILHAIFYQFERCGYLPFSANQVVDNVEKDLVTCKKTAESLRDSGSKGFSEAEYEKSYGLTLGSKMDYMNDVQRSNWFFLAVEFPGAFASALESLVHPPWYTACFMSECSNSSVWGSYGSNHTGICLIYNTGSPEEQNPSLRIEVPVGVSANGVIKEVRSVDLHKVDYERAFPKIDFFNFLGALPVPVLNAFWYSDSSGNLSACGKDVGTLAWRQEYIRSVIEVNTTKLKDWDYEKEYRALLTPFLIDLEDPLSRKCVYDFDSLNGLIFGIKTPAAQKMKAISIVKALCKAHNRNSFNFYQARYNPTANKITHHLIDVSLEC
ncbi:DUF2971 domain-containing protein [Pseudomonas syringae]|uniref:DUF2971 domain-containing protein n=1 Tax=Pseudomonas syringae TaxID=317 RepID=UPI00028CCE94|nr:DUF2971 domain-containing protein [Pseudomonas syringae]EKG39134.1 hypothetical protein Pav037_1762 [Pseudomonas syringae pv. avellanae str. ISPaVe037]